MNKTVDTVMKMCLASSDSHFLLMNEFWFDKAKEFIRIYYHFLITVKKDIYKFYDPEAIIKLSVSDEPIKVTNQLAKQIAVPLGTELNIIDYSITPTNEFCNITVLFNTIYEDQVTYGSQCFTLVMKDEKIFILSDYQNFFSPPEARMKEFFPYQKTQTPKKQKGKKT